MDIKIKSLFVGAAAGAIVAWISIYFLGYLAAITYPNGLFVWAGTHSALGIFTFAIRCVELLCGIGILAALASYFLAKKLKDAWLYLACAFLVTQTLIAYFFVPYLSGRIFYSASYFLQYLPHLIIVSLCVFIPAYRGGNQKNA
jgi:hypothetical protein